MSEFHGPKCQEMHFPAFQFPIIFWGNMPPDPPRNDGLKPIIWALRTQKELSTFHKTPATEELIYNPRPVIIIVIIIIIIIIAVVIVVIAFVVVVVVVVTVL